MTERISLDVPATLNAVPTIRRVLGGLGARLGYSLDDLDDLYLATEELLRVAFARESQERIRLDAVIADDCLEVALGTFVSPELRADVAPTVQACDNIDLCRLLHRTMDDVTVRDGDDGTYAVVLVRRHRRVVA